MVSVSEIGIRTYSNKFFVMWCQAEDVLADLVCCGCFGECTVYINPLAPQYALKF